LTCGFHYIMPEGEVTDFVYTEDDRKLVINGINLPSVMSNITSVEFALSYCTVDEATITNATLECTLNKDPTCGDWTPLLTTPLGVVPNNVNMTN
jgi:hypothetical protein